MGGVIYSYLKFSLFFILFLEVTMEAHSADFSTLKVGDKLIRVHLDTHYDAEVTGFENDGAVIVCDVWVDTPRRMKFHRDTGVNVLGEKYGFLTFPPSSSE